jgi:hypothetical protein
LTNFRLFNLKPNICGLVTAASQGPIAGSTATGQRETAGVARCFFCFA